MCGWEFGVQVSRCSRVVFVFFFLTRWSLSVFKLYRKKKGVALAVQTQGMSP